MCVCTVPSGGIVGPHWSQLRRFGTNSVVAGAASSKHERMQDMLRKKKQAMAIVSAEGVRESVAMAAKEDLSQAGPKGRSTAATAG